MEPEQYRGMFEIEVRYWWFRLKRDYVYALLEEFVVPGSRPRIADLGSGTGQMLAGLPLAAVAYGFEHEPQAIRYSSARRVERLVRASCLQLPIADGSLDAVLVLDVLEHLEDDAAAIREMRRISSPGAVCLITVPAHRFLWSPHDEVLHHKRRYTRKELERKLRENGLSVVQLCYGFATVFPVAWLVRWAKRVRARLLPGAMRRDDFYPLPAWANEALYRLCRWEVTSVRRGRLPLGLSLVAVCRPATDGGGRSTVTAAGDEGTEAECAGRRDAGSDARSGSEQAAGRPDLEW
ncbi:MAG: class I SAM-dependent methyltransferase [Gemmatimonadota bacterium]